MHPIQEPLPLPEPGLELSPDDARRVSEPLASSLDEVAEPQVDDDGLLRLATLSRGELRGLFR